jgi:bifunctional non-homologous end joining protein LigD
MGLEELVSKRRDRPYQAGRLKDWIKIKNRKHPAMERV